MVSLRVSPSSSTSILFYDHFPLSFPSLLCCFCLLPYLLLLCPHLLALPLCFDCIQSTFFLAHTWNSLPLCCHPWNTHRPPCHWGKPPLPWRFHLSWTCSSLPSDHLSPTTSPLLWETSWGFTCSSSPKSCWTLHTCPHCPSPSWIWNACLNAPSWNHLPHFSTHLFIFLTSRTWWIPCMFGPIHHAPTSSLPLCLSYSPSIGSQVILSSSPTVVNSSTSDNNDMDKEDHAFPIPWDAAQHIWLPNGTCILFSPTQVLPCPDALHPAPAGPLTKCFQCHLLSHYHEECPSYTCPHCHLSAPGHPSSTCLWDQCGFYHNWGHCDQFYPHHVCGTCNTPGNIIDDCPVEHLSPSLSSTIFGGP